MATEAFTVPTPNLGEIKVFFSYSHKDEVFREELETHLSILRRQEVICGWHDRKITAGREWAGEIDKHLDSAKIILLLISADFLASDYCYDVEMRRAMERHERGEARVISIMLRDVDWHGAPFAKLQVLPTDAKPVANWPSHDQAFKNVAVGIRKVVNELLHQPQPRVSVASQRPEAKAEVQTTVVERPSVPKPTSTGPVVAQSKEPAPHGKGQARYKMWIAGAAMSLIIVVVLATYLVPLAKLSSKDWAHATYNDPDFSRCMGARPCLQRKAEAEQLVGVADWHKVPYNSNVLNDCMAYRPCLERKSTVEKLKAVKDWTVISRVSPELLNDCMQYSPCELAKHPAPAISTMASPKPQSKYRDKDEVEDKPLDPAIVFQRNQNK